jgi:transposase
MRRCQILLASAAGQRAIEIARSLHCDDQTVRNAIHAFNGRGLAALKPKSRRPHTIRPAFDEQAAQLLKPLLHKSPRTYLVAEVAFAEGLTASLVTGETIRATLKRLGVSWRRAKRWITSPDPAYAAKKTRETG